MIHTHYDNLGVPRSADSTQIRAAYRKLASAYHPDRNPERREDAHHWMALINEAYAVLSDPDRRKEYDEWVTATEQADAEHEAALRSVQNEPEGAGSAVVTRSPYFHSVRTTATRASRECGPHPELSAARRNRRVIGTILWAACVWAGLTVADMVRLVPSAPRTASEAQWSAQRSEHEAAKRATKADCEAGIIGGNSEECYIASRCATAFPASPDGFQACRQDALRIADVIALQTICEAPDSAQLEAMCDVSRRCFRIDGGSKGAYSACIAGRRSAR